MTSSTRTCPFGEISLDAIEFHHDWADPFAKWLGGELDVTDYDLMGRCLEVLAFVWEKSHHAGHLAGSMKGPYEFVGAELDGVQGVLLSVDAMPITRQGRRARVRIFSAGTVPSVAYDVVEIEAT